MHSFTVQRHWLPTLLAVKRVMPGRLLLSLLTLTLALSGCTAQSFMIQPPAAPAETPEVAPDVALDPSVASTNRLVVIGEDGNLFTVNPDGSTRLDLTTDAGSAHYYSQPTWSSSGERIGWAELARSGDEVISAVVTSRADGTDRTRLEVPFPPFYLHWSPDDAKLAYLGNWMGFSEQTIALRVVHVTDGGDDASTLTTGQPLYFSWSPDGQQLLTHIGDTRTALIALDGTETPLTETSTNFATPQWANNGTQLLYAQEVDGRPQLVIADPDGAIQQTITFVNGETVLNFSLSPDSKQVAYTETDEQIGLNSLGPLFLFDLENEEFQQISSEPVVAFFWRPGGGALLFMSAEIEAGEFWLRLRLWDGEETRELSRFVPSPTLIQQYLPFADQYAQSTNFWSPDGSAVVYAGRLENNDQGIWVQAVDEESAPERVAEGIFAAWSPQ